MQARHQDQTFLCINSIDILMKTVTFIKIKKNYHFAFMNRFLLLYSHTQLLHKKVWSWCRARILLLWSPHWCSQGANWSDQILKSLKFYGSLTDCIVEHIQDRSKGTPRWENLVALKMIHKRPPFSSSSLSRRTTLLWLRLILIFKFQVWHLIQSRARPWDVQPWVSKTKELKPCWYKVLNWVQKT